MIPRLNLLRWAVRFLITSAVLLYVLMYFS